MKLPKGYKKVRVQSRTYFNRLRELSEDVTRGGFYDTYSRRTETNDGESRRSNDSADRIFVNTKMLEFAGKTIVVTHYTGDNKQYDYTSYVHQPLLNKTSFEHQVGAAWIREWLIEDGSDTHITKNVVKEGEL